MLAKHVTTLMVLGFLSASCFGLEPSDDPNPIDGTWLPSSAELAGQPYPKSILDSMKLVVKGNEYTVNVADAIDKGTVKLDAGQDPKAMDITGTDGPNKGKTFLTIYQLKDDTLTVCYDLSGKSRPAEFKTKEGTKLFLVTYKRSK